MEEKDSPLSGICSEQDELMEGRNIVIDFGSIEIFKERTKFVSYCRPKTNHKITYTITRDRERKLIKESFEPDHWKGIVNPNEDFNLAITYKPTLANLSDIETFEYIDSDHEIIKITVKGKALGQSHGFGAYFSNGPGIKDDDPFILSANYLDFGCAQVDETNPKKLTTCLTNKMKNPIVVEWGKGTQIFNVKPKTAQISPYETVIFEIEFKPDENYNIYMENLLAQIYWKTDKKLSLGLEDLRTTAPLVCTLRVQGYSFPQNEGWITHIEVLPEVVYWQPCLPGEKVYTTFLLQNKSHLPVMYKLVPPKITNIIAKPMIGKFRNFEIIAAQLQTDTAKVKTYIEEWKIIINGRDEKQVKIYFHGETSIPTIEIGNDNIINAGNIQEGSQKRIEVLMKNRCYFTISYRFKMNEKSILAVDSLEGTLQGNDYTKLKVTITGKQCAPKKEKFICEMHIIDKNGAISGESYDTTVSLFSECSYSELSACPSSHNFGRQPFGKRIRFEFESLNFGDSPIFFQACQCGHGSFDRNFRIKPCFGEIQPKDCKKFVIIGIISLVGEHTLCFGYYNRVSRDSPIVTGEPINFVSLRYTAEFPIIQVGEIVDHNFGPLFGRSLLYNEYLKIPRLNKILEEILNDQTEEIHLRLPEVEVQDKEYLINLSLNNVSPHDTNVSIKRKQTCDCKLVEQDSGDFSKRKKGFACPHRNTLNMDLPDTKFLSNGVQFLTITIQYCLPEKTEMCYVLQLSNHRAVNIYFDIFSLQSEIPRISLYTENFKMNLRHIFIGTRVAPVQMFWMYNNTKTLLDIEFDTTEVEHMCKIEGFKVLEILNPKQQILPYSSQALLVKFLPIELKEYTVEMDVKCRHPEKKHCSLKFVLQGRGQSEAHRGSIAGQTSLNITKHNSLFPVSLSIESIDVKMLPTWNKRKTLIFIKNNLKNKIVQYIWGTIKIDNVIEISAERKYNLLHPKEVHLVVVIVKSFSEPCVGSFLLPCEIINYTDLVIHQITKEKFKEAQDRIENEFNLTGSGKINRPKNPINIQPKPEPLYITLNIDVTTIHSKDLDLNMDPLIQLKQYPNQSMENIPKKLLSKYYPERVRTLNFPEKTIAQPTIGLNERLIFCRILEEAIGDVVYSQSFKNYLNISYESPPHYYTEFVMDDQQIMSKKKIKTPLSNEDIELYRKREIEKFFAQPKVTELSNILQNLIYESISKMVQCFYPELNIKEINEQIENSLYTCKKKNCYCNKIEDN